MPAAVAIPLISAGISGGAALAGSAMSSSASEHAADLQSTAAQEALNFIKGQKAKQENAAAPYLSLGQMATGALPGAVRPSPSGAPPSPYATAPGSMPMGQQTGYSTLSMNAPAPAYGFQPQPASPVSGAPAGGMVKLQSPDGSIRAVPSNLVQPFIERGAKVVN